MRIAIVIPAYNEAKNIGYILRDLRNYDFTVIVVDDGSQDKTYFEALRRGTYCIKQEVNLGKGAALKIGAEAAFMMGADAVVLMDGDRQHQVADLPKFTKKLKEKKYQVIFGRRSYSKTTPIIRFLGNKFASLMVGLLFNIHLTDLICGYRAFTKKAYKKIKWESSGYGVETEMVIRTGLSRLPYCEVEVESIYYDKVKGVTPFDALAILIDALKWRLSR